VLSQQELSVMTGDCLRLNATVVEPQAPSDRVVVLVHGGGVTREEGGFFASSDPQPLFQDSDVLPCRDAGAMAGDVRGQLIL
jgi:hypothetical protein